MAFSGESTRFLCLFHDAGRARAAVRALESLQVAPGAVQSINANDLQQKGTGTGMLLSELGVPDRDITHLEDGLRRGGVLVSLEAAESRSGDIERVFHKYSADKIDEADLNTGLPAAAAAPFAAAEPVVATAEAGAVIPIAEEELLVGKREVDRGGVRVYRRTLDQPVSEEVNLHSERVALEYREVNRPATEADVRAGQQEFELIETAEVPVVQKVARVVEEVHVGKVESDRTEVVEDTVRHTEVDVQPVETRTGGTGSYRS